MSSTTTSTLLMVASSKDHVGSHLTRAIVAVAAHALQQRSAFSVALSGGSLPSFLSTLAQAFGQAGVDPQFSKWHVVLADERCVPKTDTENSNLASLGQHLFSKVDIPTNQIYGIDESKLNNNNNNNMNNTNNMNDESIHSSAVAEDYQTKVETAIASTGGLLDLAVLGFGPDGHTCSLFPGHALLDVKNQDTWVASLDDSPKPPPSRITLTLPFLNSYTRNVIFCGAGASKAPILQAIFSKITATFFSGNGDDDDDKNVKLYIAERTIPPPYPCAMVAPQVTVAMDPDEKKNTVTWIVDQEAMEGVTVTISDSGSTSR